MRYTTEYNPQISDKCKKIIKNNIGSTFESSDSYVYNLDYIYQWMQENKHSVKLSDLNELKRLVDEKVDYIEF